MSQYFQKIPITIKLFNLHFNKLESGIKNSTEETLKSFSIFFGDFNDENNFLHKLLLTNTQVSRLPKALANGSSTNIKLSNSQLHKIAQS